MECDFSATLHLLFVGPPVAARERLAQHLALRDDEVRVDVAESPDQALAASSHPPPDAVLVGPVSEPAQLPTQLIARLAEHDGPPVFLLLDGDAWSKLDWSALPLACVDGVLEWEACRGPGARALLRHHVAQARRMARLRAARVRAETMTAAVARLAGASGRAALCSVAVDAVTALRASCCGVLLAEGDDLVLAQARGLPDQQARMLARSTISVSDHPVAEAARTRSPRWSRDAREHSGALPLVVDDELVGVLWVQLQRAEPDDRATLEAFAGHLADALERAREVAEVHERALRAERLVAIAAHDLRSPLQVISMGAGLLRLDDAVPPGKRFLVERIHESSERASALIDELLAVAGSKRDQGGAGVVVCSAFDLLRDCVNDFRVRMPDCPVVLSTRGTGDAAIDRDHLMQVLHNLLANAAHYREPDSTVTVRGIGAAARVYVEVHNRGPVIRDEQMAELFAPMSRGTRGGERGSLGLGLYIVKSLVEGDGGRVWARSSAEEGTTFVIGLPRTPRPLAHAPERDAIAPYRVRPADVPPAYASLLERLPEGPLTKLLGVWLELGGASHLPHPRQLDRTRLLAHLPDMFWVDVLGARDGNLQFRVSDVGGMLERRLDGRAPSDTLRRARDAAIQPSMRAAYERCARSGRPAFDYLRGGESGGEHASFTRLVLPFSEDGEHVTQLVGMALFRGFDEGAEATTRALSEGTAPERESDTTSTAERRSS